MRPKTEGEMTDAEYWEYLRAESEKAQPYIDAAESKRKRRQVRNLRMVRKG